MNKSQKIWLSPPDLRGREREFLKQVLDSNWVTTGGPHELSFEKKLQLALKTENQIVALNSGTAAVHLALILAGVKPGDVVICQTMSFIASVNPVIYAGATPVFVDSMYGSGNLNPDLLEEAVKAMLKKEKKPAAIIAVDSYGMPFDKKAVGDIASRYEIPLIEDAAEALGSRFENQACGTFGDFGILSFNGNKLITTGGGGALIFKDPADAARARHLASQAKISPNGFEHDAVGYNYGMSSLAAGLGLAQLEFLDEKISAKRHIHQFYKSVFEEMDGVKLMEEPGKQYESNFWLNILLLDPKKNKGKTPEGLLCHLAEREIESRYLWKPIHQQEMYKSAAFYGDGTAESLWENGLCLPSGSGLTKNELERIESGIKTYFSE